MTTLKKLMDWYASNCDEDWEHSYGIKIDTLDNPGWKVKVDISETTFQDLTMNELSVENSEDDWIVCYVEDGVFCGFGGPQNLEDILNHFFKFCHSAKDC